MSASVTAASGASPKLGYRRIIGFTAGDFGLNIYWQSVSLFLLFFYTDVAGLSPAVAGLIYMIASIWDGLSDPVVGALAERTRTRWGRYRPYVLFGAVPLAISFVAVYYRPPLEGWALAAFLLATHVAFRTCYAVVSIPLSALSARMTSDSDERSLVAGFKMMFGTGAALLVAWATQAMTARLSGGDAAGAFLTIAAIFAVVPLAIFPFVVISTREPEDLPETPRLTFQECVRSVLSNRAFWLVMAGLWCTMGAVTAFGKSILYYFKYYLSDASGASYALALAAAAGMGVVPLWMMFERRVGKRAAFLAGSVIGLIGLAFFAVTEVRTAMGMTFFCIYMQVSLVGLITTFWSMLPDTVEYGELKSGLRAESFIFGLGQFFLKVALGVGAGAFGLALEMVGYRPNVAQTQQTLDGMKAIMTAFPLLLLALGAAAIAFYPMRGRQHAAIVRELEARRLAGQPGPAGG